VPPHFWGDQFGIPATGLKLSFLLSYEIPWQECVHHSARLNFAGAL